MVRPCCGCWCPLLSSTRQQQRQPNLACRGHAVQSHPTRNWWFINQDTLFPSIGRRFDDLEGFAGIHPPLKHCSDCCVNPPLLVDGLQRDNLTYIHWIRRMYILAPTDCGWRTFSSAEETSGRASMAALNPGRSPATARSYSYHIPPNRKGQVNNQMSSQHRLQHHTYICHCSRFDLLHLQKAIRRNALKTIFQIKSIFVCMLK